MMYLFTRRFSRTPHPYRTPAALTVLGLLLVGLTLWASDAHAEHRDITVDFNQLDVSMRHGVIDVRYAIDLDDWHRLRHAGIEPRLNVYQPHGRNSDRFLYSMELHDRKGRLRSTERVTPRHLNEVRFRLVGHHHGVAIDQMRYGDACGDKVTVAVRRTDRRHHPGRRHAHHSATWRTELVQACSAATFGANDVATCVQAGSSLRSEGARVVQACDDATYASSDMVSCVQKATRVRRNRVGTVQACSENTYWSGDFEACLTNVAAYRANPAPVIAACADSTAWSDAFQGCLQNARGLGHEAPSIVRACGEGTYWDDAFASCMRAAAS